MSELTFDLRQTVRALAKSPAFTLGVIAVLALGLGANVLILSVYDNVVLRPLPYAEPDRLVYVWAERAWFTKREIVAFREASEAFEGVAAYYRWSGHTLIEGGEPEHLNGSLVSADFFSVLGVPPLYGRAFAAGEDLPGAEKVAVVSYGLWQRRFGGDPGLVGRVIDLDGQPTTVVGVMPRGFSFRGADRELWVPLKLDPADEVDYDARYVQAVARLGDGVSRAEAEADAERTAAVLWEELGITADRPEKLTLPELREVLVGDVRPMLVWLLIAVGSLLLIACVNVANLLLTRGAGRGRELAIRAALGCGRRRMARWLLSESLLLALAGGGAGFLLARLGLARLVAALPDWMPRTDEIAVDGRVAVGAVLLSLATGLVFGAAPALGLARARLFALLRQGSGAVGGRRRGRSLLVAAEVALAFVLVTAAGLAARSFWRAARVDPGFEPAGVHSFYPMITDARYEDQSRRKAFYRELVERLGQTPGMESVGAIHMLPVRFQGFNGFLDVEGRDTPPESRAIVNWRVTAADYFVTLRIPLVSGRFLDERDRAGAPQAVLVNETFARRFFEDEDPLGRRIAISLEENAGWLTVVGVVGDVRQNGLTSEVLPEIYRRFDQVERMVGLAFVARSSLGPSEMARLTREAVAAADPHVPMAMEEEMASVVRESLSLQRLILALAAIFAGLALVLGAAGIYGVVAFDVGRRVPEIGLRMALGARRDGVVRMILRQGMVPVVVGLLLGTGLSLALGRFVESLLFELEPGDPPTYVAMVLLLGTVAVTAVAVPAWRASRVDPLVALRHE